MEKVTDDRTTDQTTEQHLKLGPSQPQLSLTWLLLLLLLLLLLRLS